MKKAVLAGGLGVLMLLYGCASNEHLLFFTNSSIGVDISVEQSQTPVKFIVGYKRQEGVLDPIGQGYAYQQGTFKNMSTIAVKDVVVTRDGYFYKKGIKDEPHSVIAKMNFGATGGGSVGTNAAQWFATGKAAEELARNPATPAAMSGDAQMITRTLDSSKYKSGNTYPILKLTFIEFEKYLENDGKDDKDAQQIKSDLDSLDTGEFRKVFSKFHFKDGKLVDNESYPDLSDSDHQNKSFVNVLNYVKVLDTSLDNLGTALNIPDGIQLKKISDNKVLDKDDLKSLGRYRNENTDRRDSLLKSLSKIDAINKYVTRYAEKILYSEAAK